MLCMYLKCKYVMTSQVQTLLLVIMEFNNSYKIIIKSLYSYIQTR